MTGPRDFGRSSTTDDVLAGVDLGGKTAIVTGASGGLGAETARALASRGCGVTLAARDVDKAATVAGSASSGSNGVPGPSASHSLSRRVARQSSALYSTA